MRANLKRQLSAGIVACTALATMLGAVPATPVEGANPRPFVNQLTPDAAPPGSQGFTLKVAGAGFVSGSVVDWNGSARPTTFVSSDTLTATITASDLNSAGTAEVTISNPAPGGGSSSATPFAIASPTPLVFFSGAAFTTGNGPYATLAADLNSDGKMDLAVANMVDNTISILIGKGDGTFQPHQDYAVGPLGGPFSLADGDFNNDGKLDLAVTNQYDNTVSVLLGNGDGTFKPQSQFSTGQTPTGIVTADFNRDGNLDLAASNWLDGTVSILLGNGDGTFQPPSTVATGSGSIALAAGDLNGDGNVDLAVAVEFTNSASVLLGNGDGTFQSQISYPAGSNPYSLTLDDFNDDGSLDIAAADTMGTLSIMLGNGDGSFAAPVAYPVPLAARFVTSADLNGDNRPDLVVAFEAPPFAIFLGNGDGTFQPHLTMYGGFQGPVGIGDFNGDGWLDVAGASGPQSLAALLQTAADLAPTSLAFGKQAVGTASPGKNVTLTNNGSMNLGLTSIGFGGQNPGDFGETNNCGSGLSAGSNCSFDITFTPLAYGTRTAALVVTDSAAGSPQSVPLTGFGASPVVLLSPNSLVFGQQTVGTSSPIRTVIVKNTGDVSLSIYSITISGDFLERSNCGSTLPAGKNCTISTTFKPQSAGPLAGALTISDNAPGSPQSVTLSGTGTFFQISPSSVNFGNVPVGQTSNPQTVTLTNKARSAQSLGIRVQGGIAGTFVETNDCGSSLGAGASCAIMVTFSPQTDGYHQAELQVTGGGGGVLSVSLAGTGTQW